MSAGLYDYAPVTSACRWYINSSLSGLGFLLLRRRVLESGRIFHFFPFWAILSGTPPSPLPTWSGEQAALVLVFFLFSYSYVDARSIPMNGWKVGVCSSPNGVSYRFLYIYTWSPYFV